MPQLRIEFTPPAYQIEGYLVRYGVTGSDQTKWPDLLYPPEQTSPILISGVPAGQQYSGYLYTRCGQGRSSQEVPWSVNVPGPTFVDCGAHYDAADYPALTGSTFYKPVLVKINANTGNLSVSCTPYGVRNLFSVYECDTAGNRGNLLASTTSKSGQFGVDSMGYTDQVLSLGIAIPASGRIYIQVLRHPTDEPGVIDNWSVYVPCVGQTGGGDDGEPVEPPASCQVVPTFLSGNGGLDSAGKHYFYPDQTFVFTSPVNAALRMSYNALEHPNRYTVYNEGGGLIATSGWVGYSSSPGPWGQGALSVNPSGVVNMPNCAPGTYRLRVESLAPAGQTDGWEASITCQLPTP